MSLKITFKKRLRGQPGQVQVEADGIVGSGCEEATKAIRQALGQQSREELKPEWYQEEAAQQQQLEGN